MDPDNTKLAGDGASTEGAGDGAKGAEGADINKGGAGAGDEMVPKSLYENQKIRAEKAEAALKDPNRATFDPEAITKVAEAAAQRTYDQQYINEQGFPDEIKAKIEKVAKAEGITLRQAAQDGYVQYLMQEHKRAERVRQASPDAGGGSKASYAFDAENPPDVDVSTPEGAAAIKQWEEELERRGGK